MDWEMEHGRIGAAELENKEEVGGIYPALSVAFAIAGVIVFSLLLSPEFKGEGLLGEICAPVFSRAAPIVLFLAICGASGFVLFHAAVVLRLRRTDPPHNWADTMMIMFAVIAVETALACIIYNSYMMK